MKANRASSANPMSKSSAEEKQLRSEISQLVQIADQSLLNNQSIVKLIQGSQMTESDYDESKNLLAQIANGLDGGLMEEMNDNVRVSTSYLGSLHNFLEDKFDKLIEILEDSHDQSVKLNKSISNDGITTIDPDSGEKKSNVKWYNKGYHVGDSQLVMATKIASDIARNATSKMMNLPSKLMGEDGGKRSLIGEMLLGKEGWDSTKQVFSDIGGLFKGSDMSIQDRKDERQGSINVHNFEDINRQERMDKNLDRVVNFLDPKNSTIVQASEKAHYKVRQRLQRIDDRKKAREDRKLAEDQTKKITSNQNKNTRLMMARQMIMMMMQTMMNGVMSFITSPVGQIVAALATLSTAIEMLTTKLNKVDKEKDDLLNGVNNESSNAFNLTNKLIGKQGTRDMTSEHVSMINREGRQEAYEAQMVRGSGGMIDAAGNLVGDLSGLDPYLVKGLKEHTRSKLLARNILNANGSRSVINEFEKNPKFREKFKRIENELESVTSEIESRKVFKTLKTGKGVEELKAQVDKSESQFKALLDEFKISNQINRKILDSQSKKSAPATPAPRSNKIKKK